LPITALRKGHVLSDSTTAESTNLLGVFRRNPDFSRLFIGQVVSFGGD
jgi:hypothetical protein